MRNTFAQTLISQLNAPDTFLLTGDLGFMALEGVQEAFGERFINCGIAEQNMVSVAAGLAREGFKVYVYSIAPFLYARPFEQIRNDICFSNLSVCLVGNGGGYGYGHMGPTHHALEDCAAMRALGIKVFVPAFNSDVVDALQHWSGSSYLRLGRDASPNDYTPPAAAAWRCLAEGDNGVWVTLGPLTGLAITALASYTPAQRPALWACTALTPPPDAFYTAVTDKQLTVFEEHVAEGGLGALLSREFVLHGIHLKSFEHRYALRYPSERFGSQKFHQAECNIGIEAMQTLLEQHA